MKYKLKWTRATRLKWLINMVYDKIKWWWYKKMQRIIVNKINGLLFILKHGLLNDQTK